MREAHTLNLVNANGEDIELKLRINIRSQMALEKKYCKKPDQMLLEIITTSALKPSILVDVLKESLNWSGNENSVKSGEELYELLVDNGFAGMVDFMELVSDISLSSGIISKEMKDAMNDNARKSQEEMIKSGEQDSKN